MHTLKKNRKPGFRYPVLVPLVAGCILACSLFALLTGHGLHESIQWLAIPVQPGDQLDQLLAGYAPDSQVVSYQTIQVPLTNFARLELISTASLGQRNLDNDPRTSDFILNLMDYFSWINPDGGQQQLAFIRAPNDQLKILATKLGMKLGRNTYQSVPVIPVKLLQIMVVLATLVVLIISESHTRFKPSSLVLYLSWLPVILLTDKLLPSLACCAGMYCTHVLHSLKPLFRYEYNQKSHRHLLAILLFRVGPYAGLLLAYCLADLRGAMTLVPSCILVLSFLFVLPRLRFPAIFRPFHAIPAFIPIRPTLLERPSPAWYALVTASLVLTVSSFSLGSLGIPQASSGAIDPARLADLRLADLRKDLNRHIFRQYALTDGILGSYDSEHETYNRYVASYSGDALMGLDIVEVTPSALADKIEAISSEVLSVEKPEFFAEANAFSPLHSGFLSFLNLPVLDPAPGIPIIMMLLLFLCQGMASRLTCFPKTSVPESNH